VDGLWTPGRPLTRDPYPVRKRSISYLSRQKPPIILIGNSLLNEGTDTRRLASLVGLNVYSLWNGGADSAWWYLAFKNVVLESSYTPEHIYIFFRDDDLTRPTSRVTGPYERALNALANQDEPLLVRLAYPRLADRVQLLLEHRISLYRDAYALKENVNSSLKRMAAWLLHREPGDPDRSIRQIFDDGRMDPDLLTQRQLKASAPTQDDRRISFEKKVDNSFLPAIIALAKQRGIPLTFVRMKTRQEAILNGQPPDLIPYMRALKEYLMREDCDLIDFAVDARIHLDSFGTGDHLNRTSGRSLFTMLLSEAMLQERPRSSIRRDPRNR